MASSSDIEQMRRVLKERLGFEDASDVNMLSEEETEQAYKELIDEDEPEFEDRKPGEDDEGVSDTMNHSDDSEDEAEQDLAEEAQPGQEDTMHAPTMEQLDSSTQYRLFLQQAHEMAKEMAERMGTDYAPFVESGEHGLIYGASHKNDALKTKFSELPLPVEVMNQFASSGAGHDGEVYRWALAEYRNILTEARAKLQKVTKGLTKIAAAEWKLVERKDRILVRNQRDDKQTIEFVIPERIQKILDR